MKVTDAILTWLGAWAGPDPTPPTFPAPAGDRNVLAVLRDGEWHVFTYDDGSRDEAARAVKAAPLPRGDRAVLVARAYGFGG